MKNLKDVQQDNRGFSLLELIVVILMMGFIGTMLAVFVSSSRSNYQYLSTEVKLQDEAAFATSYIGDIAVETKEFSDRLETFNDGSAVLEAFYILAPDSKTSINSDKDYYYIIARETATNEMRFIKLDESEIVKDSTSRKISLEDTLKKPENKVSGDERRLLAKYVTSMELEQDGTLMKITIRFNLLDCDYTAYKVVSGRNLK